MTSSHLRLLFLTMLDRLTAAERLEFLLHLRANLTVCPRCRRELRYGESATHVAYCAATPNPGDDA